MKTRTLDSLEGDVAATNHAIAGAAGSVVLVGLDHQGREMIFNLPNV